ncbi:PTPRT-like protein, partial [Mya arenaria]
MKTDKLSLNKRAVSLIFRLVLCLSVLITLGGDVETNPGPPRSQKQRTLSFAEPAGVGLASASSPPPSQEATKRATRGSKDSEVMAFLRDMKAEVRTDLAAINSKVDDIHNSVNILKAENESLRQENLEIKQELGKLVSKVDSLEGHSRRNNLRFYGIQGMLGEKWEETELKVRQFISDKLGLSELDRVEIERAHRVGSRNSDTCPIIAKFSRYKDRETIIKKSKQLFDRQSQFSVREDFTERVQLHKRELGKRLVEARSRDQYASMRYDKLIIDDGVYKYDDLSKQVKRIGSTRPGQRPRGSGPRGNVNRPRDHNNDQSTGPLIQVKTEAASAGPPVGAIAGGVSGGVVIIISVVVAFFFLRQRSIRRPASNENKINANTTLLENINDEKAKESTTNERTYYNEGQIMRESTKPNTTGTQPLANKPTSDKKHASAHGVTTSEKDINLKIDEENFGVLEGSSRKDQTYYNEPESSAKMSKILIGQLVKYKFSRGLVKPYVESQKRENISKNRYKGIYPYDDSRVKITVSGGSDYINSSFIDGYKRPKQYIATLGPMSQQLGDFSLFWKMIWQQRVEKIVMVTNLIEQGSHKCEQYWPDPGTSKAYGEIQVKSRSEDEYAEFTRRTFTGTEERALHHLHFTCWPDKAVPDDVTAMIEFRQRVLSTPSTLNGPTVVHC